MPRWLERMTADEIEALPRGSTVVFFPVGLIEDHGPHLPVGLDLDEAEVLCRMAAERLEADLREQLKDARLQAQKLVTEAEQESDRLYREAMSLAQAESIASREQARREIDAERTAAMDQLKGDAARLADQIVDRLLAAQ